MGPGQRKKQQQPSKSKGKGQDAKGKPSKNLSDPLNTNRFLPLQPLPEDQHQPTEKRETAAKMGQGSSKDKEVQTSEQLVSGTSLKDGSGSTSAASSISRGSKPSGNPTPNIAGLDTSALKDSTPSTDGANGQTTSFSPKAIPPAVTPILTTQSVGIRNVLSSTPLIQNIASKTQPVGTKYSRAARFQHFTETRTTETTQPQAKVSDVAAIFVPKAPQVTVPVATPSYQAPTASSIAQAKSRNVTPPGGTQKALQSTTSPTANVDVTGSKPKPVIFGFRHKSSHKFQPSGSSLSSIITPKVNVTPSTIGVAAQLGSQKPIAQQVVNQAPPTNTTEYTKTQPRNRNPVAQKNVNEPAIPASSNTVGHNPIAGRKVAQPTSRAVQTPTALVQVASSQSQQSHVSAATVPDQAITAVPIPSKFPVANPTEQAASTTPPSIPETDQQRQPPPPPPAADSTTPKEAAPATSEIPNPLGLSDQTHKERFHRITQMLRRREDARGNPTILAKHAKKLAAEKAAANKKAQEKYLAELAAADKAEKEAAEKAAAEEIANEEAATAKPAATKSIVAIQRIVVEDDVPMLDEPQIQEPVQQQMSAVNLMKPSLTPSKVKKNVATPRNAAGQQQQQPQKVNVYSTAGKPAGVSTTSPTASMDTFWTEDNVIENLGLRESFDEMAAALNSDGDGEEIEAEVEVEVEVEVEEHEQGEDIKDQAEMKIKDEPCSNNEPSPPPAAPTTTPPLTEIYTCTHGAAPLYFSIPSYYFSKRKTFSDVRTLLTFILSSCTSLPNPEPSTISYATGLTNMLTHLNTLSTQRYMTVLMEVLDNYLDRLWNQLHYITTCEAEMLCVHMDNANALLARIEELLVCDPDVGVSVGVGGRLTRRWMAEGYRKPENNTRIAKIFEQQIK